MKTKKKLNLKTLSILIILLTIIVAIILVFFMQKSSPNFTLTESEIKNIADNKEYLPTDSQILAFYNSLTSEDHLIVCKHSASTTSEAQKLFDEYKALFDKQIVTEFNSSNYNSYKNLECKHLIETEQYYKFIGEFSYTYEKITNQLENHTKQWAFLVFKSEYYEYPYLKRYNNISDIKEFGDIVTVLNNSNNKIVCSKVSENITEFIYTSYTISTSYTPETLTNNTVITSPAVVGNKNYILWESTFSVNKKTGQISLSINNPLNSAQASYKNSYYPYTANNIVTFFNK